MPDQVANCPGQKSGGFPGNRMDQANLRLLVSLVPYLAQETLAPFDIFFTLNTHRF